MRKTRDNGHDRVSEHWHLACKPGVGWGLWMINPDIGWGLFSLRRLVFFSPSAPSGAVSRSRAGGPITRPSLEVPVTGIESGSSHGLTRDPAFGLQQDWRGQCTGSSRHHPAHWHPLTRPNCTRLEPQCTKDCKHRCTETANYLYSLGKGEGKWEGIGWERGPEGKCERIGSGITIKEPGLSQIFFETPIPAKLPDPVGLYFPLL